MQQKKIIKLVCVFVIIFVLLCSCVLSASASSLNTDGITRGEETFLEFDLRVQSYNPTLYQQIVDYAYKYGFYMNSKLDTSTTEAYGLGMYVCSATPLKFSQGYLWKSRSQNVSIYYFITRPSLSPPRVVGTSWNGFWGSPLKSSVWTDGVGDSLGYQFLDITFNNSFMQANPNGFSFPFYAYNSIPTIWEYIAPPSSDMVFYEKPIDTEPQKTISWLKVNSWINSGGWIDDDGNVHGGGGGYFKVPETSSAEEDSYTNNVYGNAISDLSVIYNASPDDAQPITVTFWGHTYTLLDPNFFRSEAWSAARLLLQMCCVFILILWLRKKIYQVLDHAS